MSAAVEVTERDKGHLKQAVIPPVRPKRLRLEASSHCQLKCPICETATGELYKTVAKGFLRFDNFKTLIDENDWIEEIELSNFGEIFLNPQLPLILRYAHKHQVAMFASNGVNLNTVREGLLEDLVRYEMRHMRVSLDGATPETYAKYRVRGDLGTVLDNVRKINEFKEKYGSPYPQMTWQFIIFGHNEDEIEMARDMAAELGMEFEAKLNWDEDYSPVKDKERARRVIAAGVASRSEYREVHGSDYMEKVCHQLWDAPQINFDGTVWGCCRNNWKSFEKNVFDDGLEAALNSEQMSYAREMITGNAPVREDVPCTTCRIYKNFRKAGEYLERPD